MASSRLRYEPAPYDPSGESFVELDARGARVGTAAPLRGRKWSYTLTRRGISQQSRSAREVDVDVTFRSPDEADRLRRAADRDVEAGQPGELVVDGLWRQRAYVVAFEPDVITRRHVSGTMTVVLLAGCWTRDVVTSLEPRTDASDYPWLDLPCDLPCDLKPPAPTYVTSGESSGSSDVRIVFWGPCVDPYVDIAGNRYAVDATVPAGGYLVVDGHAWPKTVTLNVNGAETDLFARAHRGTGEGGGEYCFQRIPPGEHEVSWPGSYGVDVHRYEEEGEPPWAAS